MARSQDLNAAWTLLMALLALRFLGPQVFEHQLATLRHFFEDAHAILVEPWTSQGLALEAMMRLAYCTLPLMALLMLAGVAINVIQFGFVFSAEVLTPRLEKLNPVTGFQRFMTLRTFVELVKSFFKLAIICYIVWVTVRGRSSQVLALMHLAPWDSVREVASIVAVVWWRVVAAMLVLSLLDYAFQRWQYERDLMMTVQEAREELRELEGDPRIKQRIRQIQRQVAMQRMMAEVPKADVVITNPTTYAVALRYDMANMDAPVVAAKGARLVADRIRELAVQHGVPIVEKPELARTLWRTVKVGQAIPENLFRAVAEVLAFVYRIDQRAEKIRERGQMKAAVSTA